jgi:hypothetical protein
LEWSNNMWIRRWLCQAKVSIPFTPSSTPSNKVQATTTPNASPAQPRLSPNRIPSQVRHQSPVQHPSSPRPARPHQAAHLPAAALARLYKQAIIGFAPSLPPTSTNTCRPARCTAPAPHSWATTPPQVNFRLLMASLFNSCPHLARPRNCCTASSARQRS